MSSGRRADPFDFERVCQEHYGEVYKYCLRRLGEPADAEDATQEVFIRAAGHQDEFGDHARPWLLNAARWACLDEMRRRRTRAERTIELLDEFHDKGQNPEARVVARTFLSQMMDQLTPGERRVVAERWILDSSHRDAGLALGVSTSTTRSLLTRARKRLAVYLEEGAALVGAVLFGLLVRANRRREGLQQVTASVSGNLMVPVALLAITIGAAAGSPSGGVQTPDSGLAASTVRGFSPADGAAGVNHLDAVGLLSGPAQGTQPAGSPAFLLPLPSNPSRPEDVAVSDIEPSPNYASDHAIYAIGTDRRCSQAPCSVAMMSADYGHTWTVLPSRGLNASQLVLPARAFASGVFYGFGAGGLQVTQDGGQTFTTLVPALTGYAAAMPAGASEDVAVSNLGITGYRVGVAPSVLGVFPSGDQASGGALFQPGGRTLQPVIGVGSSGPAAQVLACDNLCANAVALPWNLPTTLAMAPASSTAVAYSSSGVAVSADGGASFHAGVLPVDATLTTLVVTGNRLVGLLQPPSQLPAAFYSNGGGTTWYRSAAPGSAAGFIVAKALPGGGVIASTVSASKVFGWACSSNLGVGWTDC